MDLRGVGPVVAARTLADVGDVARFADRNRFASWTGTAPDRGLLRRDRPAPALPGREPADEPHDPHRRDHPDPPRHPRPGLLPAQARRRQDPSSKRMRCLKRRISDALYRQLLADAERSRSRWKRAREGTAGRHMNPARPACHPHTGTSDQPLPGPAPTTLPAATTHCEPPSGLGSPAAAPTRRSRQGGAPHRTNDLDGDKRRRTLQRADPGPLTTEGSREGRCRFAAKWGMCKISAAFAVEAH